MGMGTYPKLHADGAANGNISGFGLDLGRCIGKIMVMVVTCAMFH